MTNQTALQREILTYASREQLAAGSPLSVSGLAKQLAVSRTPISNALKSLVEEGLAEHQMNRGFFLRLDGREAEMRFGVNGGTSPSDDYLSLTKLALSLGSDGKITAAELVSSLGITRSRAIALLDRGVREGWLVKSAGHNWIVRLGITSEADYLRLYRFRETIEPAALREPDFKADLAELDRLRAIQLGLAAGDFSAITAVNLFEINRELHETIVSWSGNRFYVDALKRSNDLRRLIEYSKVLETRKIDTFAREHIEILNTIEKGDQAKAERLIRDHLKGARATKATLPPSPPQ